MRTVLILSIAILLVIILDYSDFFLTRLIRDRIEKINNQAVRVFAYKPISILNTALTSLLFWVPPLYLLPEPLLLEYKIMVTIIYWAIVSTCLTFYLRKKSSHKISLQALPFIVCFAVAAGVFLGPVLKVVNTILGI
ncbi:MAG: hypothetical protein ACLFV2_05830 [Desulfurivibrionaceae bacterium]